MSTAMIGNDILDIGTRKARRQRGDPMAPDMMTLGAPGQFDLPNVANVSVCKRETLKYCSSFPLLDLLSCR